MEFFKGDVLPEHVLHFEDQDGKKYPVEAGVDLVVTIQGTDTKVSAFLSGSETMLEMNVKALGRRFKPRPCVYLTITNLSPPCHEFH